MRLEYVIENGGKYNYSASLDRDDCKVLKMLESRWGLTSHIDAIRKALRLAYREEFGEEYG